MFATGMDACHCLSCYRFRAAVSKTAETLQHPAIATGLPQERDVAIPHKQQNVPRSTTSILGTATTLPTLCALLLLLPPPLLPLPVPLLVPLPLPLQQLLLLLLLPCLLLRRVSLHAQELGESPGGSLAFHGLWLEVQNFCGVQRHSRIASKQFGKHEMQSNDSAHMLGKQASFGFFNSSTRAQGRYLDVLSPPFSKSLPWN